MGKEILSYMNFGFKGVNHLDVPAAKNSNITSGFAQ
jgi:hypothetical protein